MTSKRIIPLVLVAVGCASAPVAKISFEEAFGRRQPPVAAMKPGSDSRTSPALHAALFSFSNQLDGARVGATRGQPMSPLPAQAWLSMLGEVEQFLVRPIERTSSFDVARARLILQTQFSADAQLYGDFPAAVADRAQRSIGLLSARLAALSPAAPRANVRHFLWPIQPVVITSPFGHRFHPITGDYRFHSGLDLFAEPSQPVRAVFDGTVVFSAWNGAHGSSCPRGSGHSGTGSTG